MRRKYVYKCVRVQAAKKFCSCSPPHHQLNLNYRLKRWTKAFNGTVGIFVFVALRDARNFSGARDAILKCEYIGEPLPLSRRMDYYYSGMTIGLKSLVSIFSTPEKRIKMIDKVNRTGVTTWTNKGFRDYTCVTPVYTHVVNAVKPVKIISKIPQFFSWVSFDEGKGLPDWMTNKWRIKR